MSPQPQASHADSKFIWMNGTVTPYDDAHVHVLSHSLHYGCAVFEGMRAYGTAQGGSAIFRAEEHFQRFLDSSKVLGYTLPFTIADLTSASADLIRKNGFKECYIRPLAYIDDTVRGLKLPEKPEVLTAIAVWNWGKYMGDDGQKKGVRCKVSTLRRADVASSLPFAKLAGGYLTSVLARREATLGGFDEAILLDPHGFVAEGSGENIFMVRDGKIYTPPPGYILPGITRNSVIEVAKHLGYEVIERAITRNEIYIADEVFFTGTAVEVTPIREIDNLKIADGIPGPVSKKLKDYFFKIVSGEVSEFKKWLTEV